MALQDVSSDTSVTMLRAVPPFDDLVNNLLSIVPIRDDHRAPSAAMAFAYAAPIPCAAPVTIATLLFNRPKMASLVLCVRVILWRGTQFPQAHFIS